MNKKKLLSVCKKSALVEKVKPVKNDLIKYNGFSGETTSSQANK